VRVTVSLVVLLIVAATAVSYVWRSLGGFADAGSLDQLTILLAALAAIISAGLLARIVVKVSAVRQRAKGKSRAG